MTSFYISPYHDPELTPTIVSFKAQQSPTPSQPLISWWNWLYSTLHNPTITSYPMNRISVPVTHPSRSISCRSTTSKCSSYVDRPLSWSLSPYSVDDRAQVHLSVLCISLVYGLNVISEVTRCWATSLSPISLNHSLRVHLGVHKILLSKCDWELAGLYLQIHLQLPVIVVWWGSRAWMCRSHHQPSTAPLTPSVGSWLVRTNPPWWS